ncbi:MAG: ATP-binding protein [Bdellovibrionia bacterium]
MHARNTSISVAAGVYIVAVTTVFLGAFGVVRHINEKEAKWSGLRYELSTDAKQIATSLAWPLWNFDNAQIDKILDGAMQDTYVAGIRVEANGEVRARSRGSNWENVRSNDFSPSGELLKESLPVSISNETIGKVDLYVTPRFVRASLKHDAIVFALLISLLDIILVVSLYFFLWRSVLNPLRKVERYAVSVSSGGGPFQIDTESFQGELETLRASIEKMVLQLQGRLVDIQQSEDRYRTLFSVDPDALLIIERNSLQIIDANDAASRMYGYLREELLQLNALDLSDDKASTQAALSSLKAGEQIEIRERRHIRKDQTIFPADLSARAYDTGSRLMAILSSRDVTDRVKAHESLQFAKERAETADRMKSEFLDIAAHELKTPLTPLIVLLQLAERQIKSGKGISEEIWRRVENQVEQLKVLVNDLLDVGRLERGSFTLHFKTVNITELVSEILQNFRDQAVKREIRLRMPDRAIQAEVDPVRITQVVSNIIENAIKYTPESSPIDVVLWPVSDQRVRMSISDKGPGIPKKVQEAIFSRFFRVKSDATARHSGLGLGLYICRLILELHGGAIRVASEVGAGATFEIEFPVKRGTL